MFVRVICLSLFLCLASVSPVWANRDEERNGTEKGIVEQNVTDQSITESNVTEQSAVEQKVYEKKDSEKKKGRFTFGGRLDVMYNNMNNVKYKKNDSGGYDWSRSSSDKLTTRMDLDGKYNSENFSLVTKVTFDPHKDCKFVLEDFKCTWKMGKKQKFNFGRFKTPFGIEKSQAVTKTMTCNSSSASDAIYWGRNWGGNFELETVPGGSFLLGIMNDHNGHRFISHDYYITGRSITPIADGLKLGFSTELGKHTKNNNSIPIKNFGMDIQYNAKPWRIDAEIMGGDGYNRLCKADSKSFGGYVNVAYTINDKLDVIVAADWFDPDLNNVNHDIFDKTVNAKMRFVVGANYYFDRKMVRRLMVNYEWNKPTEGHSHSYSGLYAKMNWSF